VKIAADSIQIKDAKGNDIVPVTIDVKDKEVQFHYTKTGALETISIGAGVKSTSGASLNEPYTKNI